LTEPPKERRFGFAELSNRGGKGLRAFRGLLLLGAIAAVALLPLYGDVRPNDIVTHPEWARMMLRGLDLLRDDPGINDTAAQAFATLTGRESRSWPAGQFVSGQRVEPFGSGDAQGIRASGGIGEASYAFGVARGGDYRLRLHVAAPSSAEAEIAPVGSDNVLRSFSVPAAATMGWVDAGALHLDPGAYETTVLLPEGGSLDYVELQPPCVHPIEPRGGWKPTAITSTEDVGQTVLQGLDLESELPPAAQPLQFQGGDLRLEEGSSAGDASGSGGFRSGPRGSRVVLMVDIPETGLYTLSVFGTAAGGQRWLADGCRTCLLCPNVDPVARWRNVLSGVFPKGQHYFSATLGPETSVERLKFEQKKDSPADYLATLERLGLTLGAPGPVTREKAEEARRFLEGRRSQLQRELCGDILRPGTLVAEIATTGTNTGGGNTGGGNTCGGGNTGGGNTGGGNNVPPPIIPPLPPGSPTSVVPLDAGAR
jgi:hypothetical protein